MPQEGTRQEGDKEQKKASRLFQGRSGQLITREVQRRAKCKRCSHSRSSSITIGADSHPFEDQCSYEDDIAVPRLTSLAPKSLHIHILPEPSRLCVKSVTPPSHLKRHKTSFRK